MSGYIKLLPHTSQAMLSADYWINRFEGSDALRMTKPQIQAFNNINMQKLAGTRFLYDLAGFSGAFGYGVCVRRCTLRKEPGGTEALTAAYVNDPLVVLHAEGEWSLVCCTCYQGWIRRENYALCDDRSSWLKWCAPENFLVVLADYITLPFNAFTRSETGSLSGLRLDMGVRLPLAPEDEAASVTGMYDNYIVKIPVRSDDGRMLAVTAGIPVSCDVREGYAEFTDANILRQAFKTLGSAYGWGGSLCSRDCSSLVMDVYRCFGITLPRDTAGQMHITGCIGTDMSALSGSERAAILDTLHPGDIMGFRGHTMLYAGHDGEYYVISASGSTGASGSPMLIGSCAVSGLGLKRHNGRSWLDSLSYIKAIRQAF